MNTEDIIKNATLIDVREKLELLLEGKIAKAHHIPMQKVPAQLEEIKQMPKPIVVFCKAGGRAEKIVEFLKENGISEVYNGGGYRDVKAIL